MSDGSNSPSRVQISKRFTGRGPFTIDKMKDPNPYALNVSGVGSATFSTLAAAKSAGRDRFGVTKWERSASGVYWQPLNGSCLRWDRRENEHDHA